MSQVTVSWDVSPSLGATYDVFRSTSAGNESPTAVATGITAPPIMAVTNISWAMPGNISPHVQADGTFPGGSANALAGTSVTFSGFSNPANNGVFLITGSSTTELYFNNAAATGGPASSGSVQFRPFYVDMAVTPGKTYYYKIDAVLGGLHSVESVEVIGCKVAYGFTPLPINMGTALPAFEILAGSTATNTGPSVIHGDVGVWPGTSLVGFDQAMVDGALHAGDFVAQQAQQDLTAAFVAANAAVTTGTALASDIAGYTLVPGVYSASSSLAITGTLNLDAQGDPDAVWIFKIGSTFLLAASSNIALLNGARAQNVFWAVGSSATLNGPNSKMVGNIMAQASITATADVSINGRLLARVGAVTLIDDFVQLFISGRLVIWNANTAYQFGDIMFDCATKSYQEVIKAGTSGATVPTFSDVLGTLTNDGTIVWQSLDSTAVIISVDLPPAPANVPPAPPAPPTNPSVAC